MHIQKQKQARSRTSNMEVTKVRSIFRRFRVSREDAVFYANSERHASFPRMRATDADVTANY